MRKLIIMACVGLFAACACSALPRNYTLPVSVGAGTSATSTLSGVFGRIVEIQAFVSDNSSTGNFAVAYLPLDVSMTAINISTGVVSASKAWRPTVDSTDVNGADLTSDEPGWFYIAGETIRLIITGSPTNLTWKATIKVDR